MNRIPLKFKRLIWISLLCLGLILFPLASHALNVQDVPNPRQVNGGWVTDMANILSDSTEIQLNQMISGLEATNGTEIAVVTVPETAPANSPKAFTTELFNHWGIGKADADNGVLFLISVGDRRVEIETGYGIEPILPDAKVGEIINTQITPKLKQGDFDSGVLAGTTALVSVLQAESYDNFRNLKSVIPLFRMSRQDRRLILLTIGSGAVLSILGYRQAYKMSQKSIWLLPGKHSRVEGKERYIEIVYLASFVATFSLILLALTIIYTPLTDMAEVIQGGQIVIPIMTALFVGLMSSFLIAAGLMKKFRSLAKLRCVQCRVPMKPVNLSFVSSYLTTPEKVAKRLGSVRFQALHCPNCGQKMGSGDIHIRAYVVDSNHFSKCPNCQEFLVTQTRRTLDSPTTSSTGTRLIIDQCHCCDYRQEYEEIIPRLTSDSSDSDSSGDSSSSFDSGSSSDFGGGDSGGGGAGGDW